MTVTCPSCGWSAEVPEDKIPDGGVTATCRKCQAKFEVKKELKPIAELPPFSPPPASRDTKTCPFCGEEILAVAKKCKHCGSMLDEVKAEPLQSVQEPSQPAASAEVEPEKKEMEDHKSSTSNERKPLSNLEKVLFVIFGLAVVSGISGNNPAAPAMLLFYIGVLVFRLRKKKAECHPPETKVATPPTNRRALILFSILILITLFQVFFVISNSPNTPQAVAPVQSSPADEAFGKLKNTVVDSVKSKKNDYENNKYSETLCSERYRPGSEEYKDCVHFLAKDLKSKGILK